ncbi:MAG: hypothetical protein HC767_06490 [Akkermansiaceae bacterium]|nr:hypothetical protein [Akkermansiaceae bacterium]
MISSFDFSWRNRTFLSSSFAARLVGVLVSWAPFDHLCLPPHLLWEWEKSSEPHV